MIIHTPILNAITCVATLRKNGPELLQEIQGTKNFSSLALSVLGQECFTTALGNQATLKCRWQELKRKVSDLRDPLGLIIRCCLRNPNQDGFLQLMQTPGLAKELLSGLAKIPPEQLAELCETDDGDSKVFSKELQQMLNDHLPKDLLKVSSEIQKQMIFSCIKRVKGCWIVEHPLAGQFQGSCQETYDEVRQLSRESLPAFNTMMRMVHRLPCDITQEVSVVFDKCAVFALPDYEMHVKMSAYAQHMPGGGVGFALMQLKQHETILGLTTQIVSNLRRLHSSSSQAFQEFMTAITNVNIQCMSDDVFQEVKVANLSELLSRDIIQASKIAIVLRNTSLNSAGKYDIKDHCMYFKTI